MWEVGGSLGGGGLEGFRGSRRKRGACRRLVKCHKPGCRGRHEGRRSAPPGGCQRGGASRTSTLVIASSLVIEPAGAAAQFHDHGCPVWQTAGSGALGQAEADFHKASRPLGSPGMCCCGAWCPVERMVCTAALGSVALGRLPSRQLVPCMLTQVAAAVLLIMAAWSYPPAWDTFSLDPNFVNPQASSLFAYSPTACSLDAPHCLPLKPAPSS